MTSRTFQLRVAILLCSHIFEKFPYSMLPARRVRKLVCADRHCTGKISPCLKSLEKVRNTTLSILRTDGPDYFLRTLYR